MSGSPPSPRQDFGFVSLGPSLYMFGGFDGYGEDFQNTNNSDRLIFVLWQTQHKIFSNLMS